MEIVTLLIGKILEALAKAAVEYLQWVSARKDIASTERARIYLESQKVRIQAALWKADHPIVPPEDPTKDFEVE